MNKSAKDKLRAKCLDSVGIFRDDENPHDRKIFINEEIRRIKIVKRADLGKHVVEIRTWKGKE